MKTKILLEKGFQPIMSYVVASVVKNNNIGHGTLSNISQLDYAPLFCPLSFRVCVFLRQICPLFQDVTISFL